MGIKWKMICSGDIGYNSSTERILGTAMRYIVETMQNDNLKWTEVVIPAL